MFSNYIGALLEILEVVGIALANAMIYSLCLFVFWLVVVIPVYLCPKSSDLTIKRVSNVCFAMMFLILAILLLLFISGTFRLIPLP